MRLPFYKGLILRHRGTGERLARWSATVLTMAGVGCDPPAPAPPAQPRRLTVLPPTATSKPSAAPVASVETSPVMVPRESFPGSVDVHKIRAWRTLEEDPQWKRIQKRLATLSPLAPAADREAAANDLPASGRFGGMRKLVAGKPTSEVITLALDELEQRSVYHELVASLAFQRTVNVRDSALAALLSRIEQHQRVAIALKRANALHVPVKRVPWMSKAGGRIDHFGGGGSLDSFLANAREAYDKGDAGRFELDAIMRFEVKTSGLSVLRRGRAVSLETGDIVTLRRLDVLQAHGQDVTLEHGALGALRLKKGAVLTPWNVAAYLSSDGKKVVADRVKAAAAKEEGALDALDGILPAARLSMVEALTDGPPGAPSLRLQLSLMLE